MHVLHTQRLISAIAELLGGGGGGGSETGQETSSMKERSHTLFCLLFIVIFYQREPDMRKSTKLSKGFKVSTAASQYSVDLKAYQHFFTVY